MVHSVCFERNCWEFFLKVLFFVVQVVYQQKTWVPLTHGGQQALMVEKMP